MLLDRSIVINICSVIAVCRFLNVIKGVLGCIFLWIYEYLSIVKELFDIVLRAVNVYRGKIPIPQLEQINTTIEHNRINLFDNVFKDKDIAIAIASQNVNSAVHFLLCKNLKLGGYYDK